MVQETLPEWLNISLMLFGIIITGIVSAGLIKISKSFLRDNSTGVVLAGLVIGWFVVTYFLVFNDSFQIEEDQLNPLFFISLFLPIALSFLIYKKSKKVQEFIFSIPLYWLIILQVYRTGGAIFLPVVSMGFLSSVFGIPAGIGDILAGIFAIPASYMLYKKKRYASPVTIGVTIFGIGDLVMAVIIGISISPSVLTNTILVIIPIFLVPLALIAHMFALICLKRKNRFNKHDSIA